MLARGEDPKMSDFGVPKRVPKWSKEGHFGPPSKSPLFNLLREKRSIWGPKGVKK